MTSSFNIQPQRQLRDTFEQPEQRAEIAPPAQPEQVSQQRGGQLLDFTSYQPDLELQDKVNSIANLVETGQGLMRQNVKDQAEKVGFQVDKLFDQISQYQLDTVELGETARQLRKKGRPDLAEQVISTNPWFKFHYYNKKAETAATKSVVNLNDYVTNNMGRLQQIEDPTEVTAELVKQNQNYLKQNYPDIPDRMYSGLVAPALAKAMPLLQQNIAEKRAEYNVTLLNAAANETLDGGVAAWKSGQAPGKLAENLRTAQLEYMAAGKTAIEFANDIRTPFLKNLQFDVDKNGVNDFEENPQLNNLLLEELSDFDLGDGQGMLLDYKDAESGKTMRQIIRENEDAIDAKLIQKADLENKRASLENNQARRDLQVMLSLTEQQGGNPKDVIDRLVYGGFNTFLSEDDDGNVITKEVFIPRTFSPNSANEVYRNSIAPVDTEQFVKDMFAFNTSLATGDEATQNEILLRYPEGSKQFNKLTELLIASNKKAATYEDDVSRITTSVSGAAVGKLMNAYRAALDAAKNDPLKQDIIKKRYDDIYRDRFENDVTRRANSYIKFRMQSASSADLQDKGWWADLERTLLKDFEQNEKYSTELFNTSNPKQDNYDASEEFSVATRGSDNGVKDAQPIYSVQEFITLNQNKPLFDTLYTKEPLFSDSTFRELAENVPDWKTNTGKAANLSPTAFKELADAVTLVKAMNKKLTDENAFSTLMKEQLGSNVFNYKPQSPEEKENFDKFIQSVGQELQNRKNSKNAPKESAFYIQQTSDHQESWRRNVYAAADFRIHDKATNEALPNTSFVAPTQVKVLGIYQEYGKTQYGNFIDVEVLTPVGGNSSIAQNLNRGDVITIAHARSGSEGYDWPVKVGQIVSAGNPLGLQHTDQSYDTDRDGGSGMHLHVEVARGGRRIGINDMQVLFETILSKRLVK